MFKILFIRTLLYLIDGGETMIPVYCTLIIKGAFTFAQVPIGTQIAVEAMLLVLGYDTDGVPIEA